ncbi:MAG: hypothetical protein AMXMBFR13_39020 [Phycisphaerae bacterium]
MDANSHQQRIDAVRLFLRHSGLQAGGQHDCSYLPGRSSRELAFRASALPPGVYHALMDLNFRRSGSVFYRPQCPACHQCQAIRVPVASFQPNRAQRRCWRRNQDLKVTAGRLSPDAGKHALYRAYQDQRHRRQMDAGWQGFCEFLYQSPVTTFEVNYSLAGRLISAAIADVEPGAVSTVYCYFDPQLEDRSLGTFNILWTIDWARQLGLPYVYLGYYIANSPKMSYKLNFRPCELLNAQGAWQSVGRGDVPLET